MSGALRRAGSVVLTPITKAWSLLHIWDDTEALYPPAAGEQSGIQRGAIAYRDPGNLSGF